MTQRSFRWHYGDKLFLFFMCVEDLDGELLGMEESPGPRRGLKMSTRFAVQQATYRVSHTLIELAVKRFHNVLGLSQQVTPCVLQQGLRLLIQQVAYGVRQSLPLKLLASCRQKANLTSSPLCVAFAHKADSAGSSPRSLSGGSPAPLFLEYRLANS